MKARLLSETAIHYYRRTHKPLNSFIEDTYRMAYIILAHKQFEITLTHKWNLSLRIENLEGLIFLFQCTIAKFQR